LHYKTQFFGFILRPITNWRLEHSCANSSNHFDQTFRWTDRNPGETQMNRVMRRFFKDESGVSAVEYAILMSCIAVAICSAVGIFGQGVKGLYTDSNSKIP
jgi:pilus assembly protein Flp/PilA